MIKLIFVGLLFLGYIYFGVDSLIRASTGFKPELFRFMAGSITFVYTIFVLALNNSLRFYVFWKRLSGLIANPTVKWSISVRYEGRFNDGLTKDLSSELLNKHYLGADVKILQVTQHSVRVTAFKTLNVLIEQLDGAVNNRQNDAVVITMPASEIDYRKSEDKMNREIAPLLETFASHYRPERSSYTLNVAFVNGNPFFSVFTNHVNRKNIDSFGITFLLDKYCVKPDKDKVSISKNELHISTKSIVGLKELAKDFISLSPSLNAHLCGMDK